MKKTKDWEWSTDTVKTIISRIIEKRNYYEKNISNELDEGIVMGFNFAIDMIKNDIESRGYDFEEFLNE